MPTFEKTRQGYVSLWAKMTVRPNRVAAVDAAAKRILAGRVRYEAIEQKTGVPWYFIGLCHYRESNLNWGTYLGNGQSLKIRTTIVPKGHGPFKTFEDGAIDALRYQKLVGIKDWDIARIGYSIEAFNGFGYAQYGVNSPYLWGGSNLYSKGKFIRDHVFDRNFADPQLGVMVILARMCALSPDVNARVNGGAVAPPPVAAKPSAEVSKVAGGAAVGVLAAGTAAASGTGWGWQEWAILAGLVVAACGGAYFVWHWWKNRTPVESPLQLVAEAAALPLAQLEPPRLPVMRAKPKAAVRAPVAKAKAKRVRTKKRV